MNVPTHDTSPKHFLGRKKWVPCDFFDIKKASKGPQVSTEDLQVHFEQRCGLCKENSCTHEYLGYHMNGMPVTLPET
jgi:hypothetical protein